MTARYAYDPFGKRRYTNGSYDAAGNVVAGWSNTLNAGTDRDFTGEEHKIFQTQARFITRPARLPSKNGDVKSNCSRISAQEK
ncbi:MAG TPA: hypothetical protein VIM63_00745 [Rhodoferax sp.]